MTHVPKYVWEDCDSQMSPGNQKEVYTNRNFWAAAGNCLRRASHQTGHW